MSDINLDKVKMNVVQTAANGVVNAETIFTFTQRDKFVSATYAGGHIYQGFLVGKLKNDKLEFSYCQLQTDGKMDNGSSRCEVILSQEGKIRLVEHFAFASKPGESGINIFQEL